MPPHQVLSPCMFLLLAGVVSATRHETSHTQMGPTQAEQYGARAYFIFEEEIAEGVKWQLILGNNFASVLAQQGIALETPTHAPVIVTDILNVGTPTAKSVQKARRDLTYGPALPSGEVKVTPVDSPMNDKDSQTGEAEELNGRLDDILRSEIPKIDETIAKAGASKSNVVLLVHCDMSYNRSPTVVLAWLVNSKRFSLRKAYWTLYQAKQFILNPIPIYRALLMALESDHLKMTPTIEPPDDTNQDKDRDWFALYTSTCLGLLQHPVDHHDADCKRLLGYDFDAAEVEASTADPEESESDEEAMPSREEALAEQSRQEALAEQRRQEALAEQRRQEALAVQRRQYDYECLLWRSIEHLLEQKL